MIIKVLLICIVYFLMFLTWGVLFKKILGMGSELRISNTLIIGLTVYFSVFFIFGIITKLAMVSLTMITIIWTGVNVIVLAAALIFARSYITIIFDNSFKKLPSIKYAVIGCVAIAILQIALSYNVTGYETTGWDASYYIGEISTSVYHDICGVYDVYTGIKADTFLAEYIFETFLMFNSVVCKITGIAPLIIVKSVWTITTNALYYFVIWEIGYSLWKKIDWKQGILFAGVFGINLFSISRYWPGQFLIVRSYEGKAFLANIILPMVFLFFIRIFTDNNREAWIGLFMTIFVSFSFSMSAIFLVSASVAAFGIPVLIKQKSLKTLRNGIICMLPCIIMSGIYMALIKEIISFTIS